MLKAKERDGSYAKVFKFLALMEIVATVYLIMQYLDLDQEKRDMTYDEYNLA